MSFTRAKYHPRLRCPILGDDLLFRHEFTFWYDGSNTDRQFVEETEVSAWCEEHFGSRTRMLDDNDDPRWARISASDREIFMVVRDSDAVEFRLRWC